MKIIETVLIAATISGALWVGTTSSVSAEVKEKSLKLMRRTQDDATQLSPGEMLSDLRDVRLSLGQVKQQAVNLFLESTRIVLTPSDPVVPMSPTTIDATMIKKDRKFRPARKEWLVFYVNALEPIIQMLMDDINDVDTNGRKCPPSIEKEINPLWTTWKNEVNDMKKLLDTVQELIEPDKDTNIPLANAAIALYNEAAELEKTRMKVYLIMQNYYLAEEKTGKKKG